MFLSLNGMELDSHFVAISHRCTSVDHRGGISAGRIHCDGAAEGKARGSAQGAIGCQSSKPVDR